MMRIQHWNIDPNLTAFLLAVGVMLVFWEMCRPGMVLPGVFGLLLASLASVKLLAAPRNPPCGWWLLALVIVVGAAGLTLGWAALQGYWMKRRL